MDGPYPMIHPMLEKVARALYENGIFPLVRGPWNDSLRKWDRDASPEHKRLALMLAHAAIAAMREPTDKMIRIAEITSDTHCMICPTIGWECATKIWQAMIDHILKGEG